MNIPIPATARPGMLTLLVFVCLSCSESLTAQQAAVPEGQHDIRTKPAEEVSPTKLPREGDSPRLDYLRRILQEEPHVLKKLQREAEVNGQPELAEWLRSKLPVLPKREMKPIPKVDPLEPARVFVKQEKWNAACDAYLRAFRSAPDLFTFTSAGKPIHAFRKAERLAELASFFDETTLQKMDSHNHGMEPLFFALLRNQDTQPLAYKLLERVFLFKPYSTELFLRKYPDRDFWKGVPDPVVLLRCILLPKDFSQAGWRPFFGGIYYTDTVELSKSLFTLARPLYQNREALQHFARDLRKLLEKHPAWEAGWAVLTLIEAESGNHREATLVLQQRFLQRDSIEIPAKAAWSLGECLAGKDDELDQAVIKLLESCIQELAGNTYNIRRFAEADTRFLFSGKDSSLRFSPIRTLAKLYAANGRPGEARQLLYGLIDARDQHPLVRGYVINSYDRSRNYTSDSSCFKSQCNACHREERSFYDFIAMSDAMTDIGYPIDSLVALGRIDRSFGNAFSSSRGWIESKSAAGKRLNEEVWEGGLSVRRYFNDQLAKARTAVNPRLVVDALERDTFRRSLRSESDQFAAIIELSRQAGGADETTKSLRTLANQLKSTKGESEAGVLDLITSLRGTGDKAVPTVFSPVIEILILAVNAQDPQANKDIAALDRKLLDLSETESGGIEAGIAATMFAFLRYDFDAAGDRMKKLQELRSAGAKEPQRSDLGLWLVARYALADDRTKALGRQFAERAIAAAEKQSDPRWKQAILWEQKTVMNQAVLRH